MSYKEVVICAYGIAAGAPSESENSLVARGNMFSFLLQKKIVITIARNKKQKVYKWLFVVYFVAVILVPDKFWATDLIVGCPCFFLGF